MLLILLRTRKHCDRHWYHFHLRRPILYRVRHVLLRRFMYHVVCRELSTLHITAIGLLHTAVPSTALKGDDGFRSAAWPVHDTCQTHSLGARKKCLPCLRLHVTVLYKRATPTFSRAVIFLASSQVIKSDYTESDVDDLRRARCVQRAVSASH